MVRRWLWQIVEATLFRWSPRPWHAWRAWLLKAFGAEIPQIRQVVVFPSVRVLFPWRLTLHPRAMIGRRVNVYNVAPIRLEYGANVSQNSHLCSGTHDFNRWSMPLIGRPIVIGPNAWLGADVFVGPGVTVGELSVIGARAVVVKDFPSRMIGAGNPCRPIKARRDPE
jgi:putative colanic acid biosynthesis acetyltransferase WcaF